MLPCSSQRWRRRASFWPVCSMELQHDASAPRQSSARPTTLLALAAFACAYLAAPARLLDRTYCRWTLLPCSGQRWRRRASFWPDYSTELQHDARATRQSSSPCMRLLVLAAFACACLAAPLRPLDRICCRRALLPCSSQRWRRRASFCPDCSTVLHSLLCHAHPVFTMWHAWPSFICFFHALLPA